MLPTEVSRVVIRWADELLRAEVGHEAWNVTLIHALTFGHHVQLHTTTA